MCLRFCVPAFQALFLSVVYIPVSRPSSTLRHSRVLVLCLCCTVSHSQAAASYLSVKTLCDNFDAETASMLSSVGGDEYATVAQLTYRQVWAGMQIAFVPSRNTPWFFLKEISSCGCLSTAEYEAACVFLHCLGPCFNDG